MNSEYVLRRSGQAMMTVVVVVTITFAMIRMLPGGPGVFQCITSGTAGGSLSPQCQEILDQSGSAGLPLADLAVIGLFIGVLLVLSAFIWKGY